MAETYEIETSKELAEIMEKLLKENCSMKVEYKRFGAAMKCSIEATITQHTT